MGAQGNAENLIEPLPSTSSHGYRPSAPGPKGGKEEAQVEAFDSITKQLFYGCEMPWVLSDHHCIQSCTDCCALWRLQYDALSANRWNCKIDRRLFISKEG